MDFGKIGAVKIVPPKNWKHEFSFTSNGKKLTTRIQKLRDLAKGVVKTTIN